jgi:hypothetical protein
MSLGASRARHPASRACLSLKSRPSSASGACVRRGRGPPQTQHAAGLVRKPVRWLWATRRGRRKSRQLCSEDPARRSRCRADAGAEPDRRSRRRHRQAAGIGLAFPAVGRYARLYAVPCLLPHRLHRTLSADTVAHRAEWAALGFAMASACGCSAGTVKIGPTRCRRSSRRCAGCPSRQQQSTARASFVTRLGVTDFERLRAALARRGSHLAFLFAFDVLELDGEDLRREPWEIRRATLTRLLRQQARVSAFPSTSGA